MTQTASMTVEPPQPLRALERANEVRLARAELKRRIADGEASAAQVILASPWEAKSWPVGDILISQRRWGSIRARKLLVSLEINERRPLKMLTPRQRQVLATKLEACSSTEFELLI